jgi:hypothetical protein
MQKKKGGDEVKAYYFKLALLFLFNLLVSE